MKQAKDLIGRTPVALPSKVMQLTALGPRYGEPNGYAQFYSRSRHAVIRVYDATGNVIQMREHKGDFKEP